VGAEAKNLFDKAQEMLKDLIENKKIRASVTYGFWSCNSVGDDIEIYDD
jgi:5-methyltetrahydrofolate--homocysteine methyltransferase